MLLHSLIYQPLPDLRPQIAAVFLHYFGGSLASWRAIYPLVQERCPECLVVGLDLRGHGDSPDGPTHRVADMARDVHETLKSLDALDGLPFIVVGHSMGGKVALQLAAMQLPQLHGLVLIAPSPPTPEPMTEEERVANIAAWGQDEASHETLRKITGLPFASEDAEQFVRDRARVSQAAWHSWFSSGSRESIADLMSKVRAPAIILVGENDPVVPPGVQRRQTLGYVHNSLLLVVPSAGHLLPYEAPDATTEFIVSSLPFFAR